MALTIKIRRSEGQWIAKVPQAKGLIAWSPSLQRLRRHVDGALQKFFPELAGQPRREVIELPAETRHLLKGLAKAEQQALKATKRAAALRRQASQRLRSRLGISVREVGDLMGVSGTRAQQLLTRQSARSG
jgi:hypothetical protein